MNITGGDRGLEVRHFVILAVWTVVVLLVTGAFLFVFTYGDCFGDAICRHVANRNLTIIAGTGFVVYWAVFIALIRKWNR
jgi:hypothetical protein